MSPSRSTDPLSILDLSQAMPPLDEGVPQIRYSCEADMRTCLAGLACAYGWLVREELVVPGWGRIDLVLNDGAPKTPTVLIELKQRLTRPSDIRKAFQQADGYGRWWASVQGKPALTILSAAKHAPEAVAPVQDAYPEVKFCDFTELTAVLGRLGDPRRRADRARGQLFRLQERIDLQAWGLQRVNEAIDAHDRRAAEGSPASP